MIKINDEQLKNCNGGAIIDTEDVMSCAEFKAGDRVKMRNGLDGIVKYVDFTMMGFLYELDCNGTCYEMTEDDLELIYRLSCSGLTQTEIELLSNIRASNSYSLLNIM